MLNYAASFFSLAMIALGAAPGWGHGTPITVEVIEGALSVSHSSPAGYAPDIFGQAGSESDPQGPLNVTLIGEALRWDQPGIDLNGVSEAASLHLDPLLLAGPSGVPRTLWHWNPATRDVAAATAGVELVVLPLDGELTRLNGQDTTDHAPITLANNLVGLTDYDAHHDLAKFAMPYHSNLPSGLYGFFARFTSNTYEASQPFLTIFNVQVSHDDLVLASDALWGAAFPGDYNRDGQVDSTDDSAWRSAYGSDPTVRWAGADGNGDGLVDAADYTVWRDQQGMPLGTGRTVPEPSTIALLLVVASCSGGRRR